jgi:hypothetical protein
VNIFRNSVSETTLDSLTELVQYMSEGRFKQIRSAFHPEDKQMASLGGDKCYQLRRAINNMNAFAKFQQELHSVLLYQEG